MAILKEKRLPNGLVVSYWKIIDYRQKMCDDPKDDGVDVTLGGWISKETREESRYAGIIEYYPIAVLDISKEDLINNNVLSIVYTKIMQMVDWEGSTII